MNTLTIGIVVVATLVLSACSQPSMPASTAIGVQKACADFGLVSTTQPSGTEDKVISVTCMAPGASTYTH